MTVSLFDILLNLFPHAAAKLKSLADVLDTPENAMTLGVGVHGSFDNFSFCLVNWVGCCHIYLESWMTCL